jgi:proprotein convertase subtilisin/kexin type 5
MIDLTKQTCQSKCDPGWTSNGDPKKHCSRCESSCETCSDNGKVGDRNLCLTCGILFNFLIPSDYSCIGPNCTGSCESECPAGMYDGGNGVCMRCDPSCRTCFGSANNCKSCYLASFRPFLFDSACIEQCPSGYGSNAGVCHKCESPCKSCGTGPSVCTSCDGTNGLSLNLGPTCVASCPTGFITNLATGDCEGCGAGCINCDKVD